MSIRSRSSGEPSGRRKGNHLGLHRGVDDDLEKSAGFAATVRVATERLSLISAPVAPPHPLAPARRRRQRSKVSLCRKNSSPQNERPLEARRRLVIPVLVCPAFIASRSDDHGTVAFCS